MTQPNSSDLLTRTLRTTAILVGACVLFVGTLSTVAVVIASKVADASSGGTRSTGSSIEAPLPNKTPPAAPLAGMKSKSI